MGGHPVRARAAVDPLSLGPAPPGEPWADVVQTHTSAVVLLGDRAFKVKKPVRLPFVDLSSRAGRRRNCRDEVTLNSRFAPDVYLGVLDLVAQDRGRASGEPVVAMRRMPSDRRLSRIVAEGRHDEALRCVDAVARRMAAVHAALPALDDYPLGPTLSTLWRLGDEQMAGFAQLLGGPDDGGAAAGGPAAGDPAAGTPPSECTARAEGARRLAEVAGLAGEYLSGRARLLAERERRGLVRDGHGDLLADDVFLLDDGPRILDCLEFDAQLRHGDVLLDVAFLAMDLEFLGAPALARSLLAGYRRYSGWTHPRSLEDHYVAYRAFVRSKVQCLRREQGDAAAAARARRLLELCLQHLHRGRVHLVLLGGLPGSGKSSVAAAFASLDDDRDWAVVGSDVVRKELAGLAAGTPCPSDVGTGLYTATGSERTYAELGRRAATALGAGVNVVLDATWTDAGRRDAARRIARQHGAVLDEVRCDAPYTVCLQRLSHRTRPAAGSDAGPDVLEHMARVEPPWPAAVALRTDRPVPDAAADLLALVDAAARTARAAGSGRQ